ncbi:MAG TPA: TOMM precursor leader peptide-binding protein [Candidatus Angelobacter sp.]|nr:TOMM precursor leader peptide-binding protein [Candidatus Angelobacter sp.]
MLKRDFVVRKPCLHRSYEIFAVPGTDDIQFQSEGRSLRLKPCDSSGLLDQLISLLDGTRTVDDILNEMRDFDESQILDSLQQLFEARLVEDAAPGATRLSEDQQQFYSSQLTFFSQYSTEPHRIQDKLAASQVGVIGLGAIGCSLLSSLADNGIGELLGICCAHDLSGEESAEERMSQQCRLRNPWVSYRGIRVVDEEWKSVLESLKGLDFLVLAMEGWNPGRLESLNEACLETNTMWMPIGIRAQEGYLGPTIVPHQTACYKCYELRLKANLVHYEPHLVYEQHIRAGHIPRQFGRLPQFRRTIADMAALEVIRLLTRFSPPTTYARMFTLDLLTFDTQFHDVLKLPRCPACGERAKHRPPFKAWSD